MESKAPRRERERLRHRQEILDAARRVLAMRGIEGVTVEEVAREAEFAVGSIYRHFNSKEELLELVVGDFIDDFVEDAEGVMAEGKDFGDTLRAFVDLAFRHFGEDEAVIRALLAAGPPRRTLDPAEHEQFHVRMRLRLAAIQGVVEALLVRGQDEGILAQGDRRLMAMALVGTIAAVGRSSLFTDGVVAPDLIAGIPASFLDGHRARP